MDSEFHRVTRADVARRAMVTETIVSYVINNNRYVDSEKRKRVQQAIAELNYKPSNIARALKGKNTNSILFIADQIANEHFSRIVVEMDFCAYDYGYLISLCQNRNDEAFVSQVICRQYDGIVISSISIHEEYIRQFVSAGIPVVLFMNRDYANITDGVGRIFTGLYDGAKDCVKHLYEKGRKNILYLDRFSRNGNFSSISDLRYRGFVEQMAECGLSVTADSVVTGCVDEDDVLQAIKRRISTGAPVDAIFGRNDRLACIGMLAAHELGLRVPEDISVIGFDNSSLSKYISPKLTTVEMQRGKIGKAAVEMLHQMIGGTKPDDVYFTPQLITREST